MHHWVKLEQERRIKLDLIIISAHEFKNKSLIIEVNIHWCKLDLCLESLSEELNSHKYIFIIFGIHEVNESFQVDYTYTKVSTIGVQVLIVE